MVMAVVSVVMGVMVVVGIGADAADMMVVAGLRRADLGLVADHLLAIFAEPAVHAVVADQELLDALDEGVEDQRVVVEIVGLEELDLRMTGGDLVGLAIDALDQDAGEQEVREHDDAAEAELHGLL